MNDIVIKGDLNHKFRLILIGVREVGKTCIINQYINNQFREEYYPTKDLM